MLSWRTPCPTAGSFGFNGKMSSHQRMSPRFALSSTIQESLWATSVQLRDGDRMPGWMKSFSQCLRPILRNRFFDRLPKAPKARHGALRLTKLSVYFGSTPTTDEASFLL